MGLKLKTVQMIMFINEKNSLNSFVRVSISDNPIILNHAQLKQILNSAALTNNNIYLKGGAARLAMLLYLFKGKKTDYLRDIDYAYIGAYKDYNELYKEKFYEDIEADINYEGDNIDGYFKSRDNTFNEVLLNKDFLFFTRRSYRDYKKNVLNLKTKELGIRASARTILFHIRYGSKIPPQVEFFYDERNTFEYLIVLLKAVELNLEEEYFAFCKEYFELPFKNVYDWFGTLYYYNDVVKIKQFNQSMIDFIDKLPDKTFNAVLKNNDELNNYFN